MTVSCAGGPGQRENGTQCTVKLKIESLSLSGLLQQKTSADECNAVQQGWLSCTTTTANNLTIRSKLSALNDTQMNICDYNKPR